MKWKLASLLIGLLLILAGGVYIVWRGVPLLLGSIVRLVPVSWEERLGSAVSEGMDRGPACDDAEAQATVEEIVARLSAALPPSPYRFRVRIVRSPQVNAMAAPGGYIVLYSGLVNKMDSAEELAAVIAHEMQHVVQRHSTQGILRAVGLQLLLSMVLGDAGGFGDLAGNLGAMHFARSDEWSADEGALENLMRAGISPAAMGRAFGHLAEGAPDQGGVLLAYLSTHPPLAERIEHAKAVESKWRNTGRGNERPLGIRLREACVGAR